MAINQAKLNELTIKAGHFLESSHHDRLAGVRLIQQDDYCKIELINPNDTYHPILIDTRHSEITLSFGECHTHFDIINGNETEASLADEMLDFARDLINANKVSFSVWRADRCLGGGWLSGATDLQDGFTHFPEADRMNVVGWNPSCNASIPREK